MLKIKKHLYLGMKKGVEGRELDCKLLTTVQQYYSDSYCKLVSLNLHEKRIHF